MSYKEVMIPINRWCRSQNSQRRRRRRTQALNCSRSTRRVSLTMCLSCPTSQRRSAALHGSRRVTVSPLSMAMDPVMDPVSTSRSTLCWTNHLKREPSWWEPSRTGASKCSSSTCLNFEDALLKPSSIHRYKRDPQNHAIVESLAEIALWALMHLKLFTWVHFGPGNCILLSMCCGGDVSSLGLARHYPSFKSTQKRLVNLLLLSASPTLMSCLGQCALACHNISNIF